MFHLFKTGAGFVQLSTLGTWILCLSLSLIICHFMRLIYFHPLSKYPGPLLAKITDAYGAYGAFHKSLHLSTYFDLQKYGNVVRQGPNKLMFNSLQAAEDIYLDPRAAKGQSYLGSQMGSGRSCLLNILDRNQHRQKRKVIAPVLADRYLKQLEPAMISQVTVFLQQILSKSSQAESVDMSPACQHLATDIVSDVAFGCCWNMQTDETNRYTSDIFDAMSWRMVIYMQWTRVIFVEKIILLLQLRKLLTYKRAMEKMIRARMGLGKAARYDLYAVAANDEDLEGKTKDSIAAHEIWPEAGLFIMAGGGPTSAALASVFFYLSRNPSCQKKLASEIRAAFSSGDEIKTSPKLSGCKYLRACIDEAMRMSPPSMALLWRVQDQKYRGTEPWIVDGQIIPQGVEVCVPVYAIFHNEDIFPDPFVFQPERWLAPAVGDTLEAQACRQKMRKALTPFSIGDRACPAKSFSMMELNITIARTLWYFDFAVAPGKDGMLGGGVLGGKSGRDRPGEYQLDDIFYAGHRGPKLVFQPRPGVVAELRVKV